MLSSIHGCCARRSGPFAGSGKALLSLPTERGAARPLLAFLLEKMVPPRVRASAGMF